VAARGKEKKVGRVPAQVGGTVRGRLKEERREEPYCQDTTKMVRDTSKKKKLKHGIREKEKLWVQIAQ